MVDDVPEVVFYREAVSLIQNFLFTRFDQYENSYFHNEAITLEMLAEKIIEKLSPFKRRNS